MKTIAEHFRNLPKNYRKEAIEKCTNPHQVVNDIADALELGFSWGKFDGYDIWNGRWNRLCDKIEKLNNQKVNN